MYQTLMSGQRVIPKEQILPDILILMGDLNYRIDGYKPTIMQAMSQDRYEMLINRDQLNAEIALGNVPSFFNEGQIAFAPTFKRKPYDNASFKLKRNPAWTDRVLYHCNCQKEVCDLELKGYDSNNLVSLSDHRPVFAQFLLKIDFEANDSESAVAEDSE